jgi:polysaccharide pyruvyl transferase WcaK-like protein
MTTPKVLCIGYNGANNTGAEALLLADIADLRAVLGPEALLTVPTLNEHNLRRYLKEGPNLHIVRLPPVFPLTVRRLVQEHDLVMLVEGSAYMDTWTSVLLWYFLWATRCAHAQHKPSFAYAVDAGAMSPFNQCLTRHIASQTERIIVRSQAAADRLHSWGVTAPMVATADNAFNFYPAPVDADFVQRVWPAAEGAVGLAVVDFYLWPVVIRPWGRPENCYRWPYYFSCSPERRQASQELAAGYAALADRLITQHHKAVALICMEQVDEPLARAVLGEMRHADRARIFSAREYNASQMTLLLRSLDLLITSRYHACVLSLAAQVPQIAVGHDLRLQTIYAELGVGDDYFIQPDAPEMFAMLQDRAEALLANPYAIQELLRRGYLDHLAKARQNRRLLREFVQGHGWKAAL